MIKQLLVILKLVCLIQATCHYDSIIPQLHSCKYSNDSDSAIITNQHTNTNTQQYIISTTTSNSQFALTINQINLPQPYDWSITINSHNDTTILISFSNSQNNWIRISVMLWASSRTDITLGVFTINQQIYGSVNQQVEFPVVINNPQSSLVLTFLNAIKITTNTTTDIQFKASKLTNKSFFANITVTNSKIQLISFSYIVFSPTNANFQSYGDLITINKSQSTSYIQLPSIIPSTSYKLYGLTTFSTKQSQLIFNSNIDDDFVLSITSNSKVSVQYVYLSPIELKCNNCSNTIIYEDMCVASCPNGTFLQNYGDSMFCVRCSDKLHLQVDSAGLSCICKKGYQLNRQYKCITSITLADNSTKESNQSKQGKSDTVIKSNSTEAHTNTTETHVNTTEIGVNKTNNTSLYSKQQVNTSASRKQISVKQIQQKTKNITSTINQTNITVQNNQQIHNNISVIITNTDKTTKQAYKQSNDTKKQTHTNTTNINNVTIVLLTSTRKDTNNTSNQTNSTNISRTNKTADSSMTPIKIQTKTDVILNPPQNKAQPNKLNQIATPAINIIVTSTPNCSIIPNSILINGKCVCTMGYINITNNCIPLTSLGTPFIDSIQNAKPAVKSSGNACPADQQYSVAQNKCKCLIGYQMDKNGKCVSACTVNQTYDMTTKQCQCLSGYARINNICVSCHKSKYYSGNQTCYPLIISNSCRTNYTLSSNYCLSCNQITIKTINNQKCNVCSNGLIYNGSACDCPSDSKLINFTCIKQLCGNAKIDNSQTCDDNNTINGDGCSSECYVQSGYFCQGVPSTCSESSCGNGVISGGQQCDDKNINNNDGCSSLCLVEVNYTCMELPSVCLKGVQGNMTIISTSISTNNVYIVVQTPKSYSFSSNAFMQTFMQYNFINNTSNGVVYCQQELAKLNRFDCLLIFPSGVPNSRFFVYLKYNYENTTGSIFVSITSTKNTLSRRTSTLI